MGKFRQWIEGVGRYLPDELEQQIRAISAKAYAAFDQVGQTQQPETVGRLMGKRTDSDGKVRRFMRTVVVVWEPNKPGRGWDDYNNLTVYLNAAKMAGQGEEAVYNVMIHELIHTTDPQAGDLSSPERDYSKDDERIAYMSSRHEFDAHLGMITNWLMRSPNAAGKEDGILSSLAAGRWEGLPPDLQKVGSYMMRLAPPLKKKFMSRIYQTVAMKRRGERPAAPDYGPSSTGTYVPIPAQPLTGSAGQTQ